MAQRGNNADYAPVARQRLLLGVFNSVQQAPSFDIVMCLCALSGEKIKKLSNSGVEARLAYMSVLKAIFYRFKEVLEVVWGRFGGI